MARHGAAPAYAADFWRLNDVPPAAHMTDIRPVTPDFAVAPQLTPDEMKDAAAHGFTLVINNRPDDEVDGQPTSAQMQAAAQAAGLHYVHIPVRGSPTDEQVQAVNKAIEAAHGPVLAFCRSGTRSIITWSAGSGGAPRRGPAKRSSPSVTPAGYDISGVLL